LREAHRQEELIKAPPLKEDVAKADADVRAAENRVTGIEQQLSSAP